MESRALFVCVCVVVCAQSVLGQVGSLCRPNERLLSCGGCQATCSNPVPDCKGLCIVGCYCEEGEVRNASGHCIKLSECLPTPADLKQDTTEPRDDNCPENEEYRFCEPCNRTCDNPNPICPAQCARGCFCKGDLVRDKDGRCISFEKCSNRNMIKSTYGNGIKYAAAGLKEDMAEPHTDQCPENEEFRFCESCNRTCDNPNYICPAQCARGCFCKDDLVRDKDGRCVSVEKCFSRNIVKKSALLPPIPLLSCGPRQVFKLCETCEKTCSNPNPKCTRECIRGCFCQEGYYKAPSGMCVRLEDCPKAEEIIGGGDTSIDDCAHDEEYFSCGWCEPSCSDPHPDCPRRVCTSGCLCKPPLLRHRSGHCVNAIDCIPQKCSQPNEEYVCRYGCEARCNANVCPGRPRRCTLGCHCKLGLVRDAQGMCIPPENCGLAFNNLTLTSYVAIL